jgi:hypothetical protein
MDHSEWKPRPAQTLGAPIDRSKASTGRGLQRPSGPKTNQRSARKAICLVCPNDRLAVACRAIWATFAPSVRQKVVRRYSQVDGGTAVANIALLRHTDTTLQNSKSRPADNWPFALRSAIPEHSRIAGFWTFARSPLTINSGCGCKCFCGLGFMIFGACFGAMQKSWFEGAGKDGRDAMVSRVSIFG